MSPLSILSFLILLLSQPHVSALEQFFFFLRSIVSSTPTNRSIYKMVSNKTESIERATAAWYEMEYFYHHCCNPVVNDLLLSQYHILCQ